MIKRVCYIFVLLFLCTNLFAQSVKWNVKYQTYINTYKDIAIEEMIKHGVPASITLAQGLLESGAGLSQLAKESNNHFGIKCHGWMGNKAYNDDDEENECFRAYNTVSESYTDHSLFLKRNQRYSKLFQLRITDYKGWARGLKAAGYATNPIYANKLIAIIECYKLYEYDNAKKYNVFIAEHSGNKTPSNGQLHPIMIRNDNYYLIARNGDTFKSIGEEVEISYRKLAKYNERDKNSQLQEGDIIYLKAKRSKAEKKYKNKSHKVQDGESMYSISQLYGMKLKSLYKKNKLDINTYRIKSGDLLRVY